jgi:hypothetical protein
MRKKLGKILLVVGSVLMPLTALADTSTELSNPLGVNDPKLFIARILRYALGFLGILGLVMILYGGFLLLTSGGNADIVKKAKSTIIYAALGIAIVIGSWQILSFILRTLNSVAK